MRYIYLVALIFISSVLHAQVTVLKGTVQDSSKVSVSSALLTLYKSGEEKSLSNTFADSTGNFIFSVQDPGNYYIVTSAIGYLTSTSALILVDHDRTEIILKPIIINRKITLLAEVKIVAPKSLLSLTNDKIVYNVENDPSLTGLSAADAFSRVPFVAVDGLGNVQLKGQSNYRILLNGKPTSMFAGNAGDALRAFPVSNISKIEVITNPSAKYEGEGLTGLINIVTKKSVAGFNGSTSLTIGTLQKGTINPNNQFSYKNGKIGISSFVYYVGNLGFESTGLNTYNSTANNALFAKRRSNDTTNNEGYQYSANLGIDYDIDSLNSIVFYGRVFETKSKRKQISTISQFNQSGSATQYSLFNTNDKTTNPGFESGVDYIKSYAKPGKEFSISFNHQQRDAETEINSAQFNNLGSNRYLQNSSTAKNQQTTLQSDLIFPFSKGSTLEFGTSAIIRTVKSDFVSASSATVNGPLIVQPSNTDILKYHQNIFGGYVGYAYSKGNLTIKVGTRIEQTNVNGDFISSATKIKQDYTSFLPSGSLVYQNESNKRFLAAYNRRLARPGLQFLNPFIDNRDPLFISFGNEKLEPEFANNFELSFSSFASKLSYSIGLNASLVDDGIQRFIVFDQISGISQQTYGNVGKSSVYGLNGFFSLRPFKGFSYSLNFNQNYAEIINILNPNEQNKGFYTSLNHTINYEVNPK
ncbi:MAG: TonB-dependent receptor, partial [Flavobacterium sp.]